MLISEASTLRAQFLNGCNLAGCEFVEGDLHRAFLAGSDMRGCDLSRAELDGTVFTGTNLENVKLLAYSLSYGREPVNLEASLFGDFKFSSCPHINESEPYVAGPAYRSLKAYFIGRGDYDRASWAAFSEKLMERKVLWANGQYGPWICSKVFGAICGYGELPVRVVASSLGGILIFAVAFWLGNCLSRPAGGRVAGFWDALYFSTCLFAGVSFGDLVPSGSWLARLLVSAEALSGIFVFGLFIFTVTKRYVAR